MTIKYSKVLWHATVAVLTLAIAVLAIKALLGLIKNTELSEVLGALSQISYSAIAFAAIIVAIGYLILTLYDAIAFKHLGIKIPFSKVSFTSFTAYAIGHTIGLAVLSASGVRYRLYRANDVDARHIANVIWLVSMAFTFGLSTLVGLSLSINPEATVVMMTQLDTQLQDMSVSVPGIFKSMAWIRGIGLTILTLVIGIVSWSGRAGRHVKIRGWRFDLPPATMLIKQILISIIDLVSVAFVLYILLPRDIGISFGRVFSAFIQSSILAILSHVPGGIGVFELTMVASLPEVDKPYLLAVLLVFRLLYYILPFIVALIFFLGHEVWLQSKQRWGDRR